MGDQSQQTNRVSDAPDDVNIFLFYFENVAMRGKFSTEKSLELTTHLDGEAFQLFFDKFTKNGKLNYATSDFEKAKIVFLDAFSKKEDRTEVITCASEDRLDQQNLTKSLTDIEKLYVQAKFDDAANLGFFRIAVKEVEPMREFVVVRAATMLLTNKPRQIPDFWSVRTLLSRIWSPR